MSQNARTSNGQFGAGNQFSRGVRRGKGNRRSSRMWTEMIRESCTPEVWQSIIDRAIAEACGEVEGVDAKSAREWLSRFVADASCSQRPPTIC